MPPSAASRSSAAIAAGAMHRCLWLQHKPVGAAQRGGHRRWLLHSTGAHIAFGGLAQLSGRRRLRCILLPFWLRCTPPCGITAAAATTALAPCCRTQLKRVRRHSCSAAAHSALGSCSSRRPWRRNSAWQPRRLRPRCGAQLRRTLPSAASPGVAVMPLASHTAAFSCVATQLRGDSGYPLGRCPGDPRLAA